MCKNQLLYIVDNYIPDDSYTMFSNIIDQVDTAGEVVKRELYINFDYYATGTIDCNIIYLNPYITAVLCSYTVESPTAEAVESDVSFLASAEVNMDAVVYIKDVIDLK